MVDVRVPVVLPNSADDYLSSFGTAAKAYLEYAAASAFSTAVSTASAQLVSGTERYEFAVSGVTSAHYYRARFGGTTFTDYLPTFQMPLAYATVQEFTRGLDFPDDSREDEFDALLIEATDHITNVICHRSFFRDPVGSGDTTKTLDILGGDQEKLSLSRGVRMDILSVTSVSVAEYTGAALAALGTADYFLVPDDPVSGQPYTDVVLSDQASTYTTWPVGRRVVSITGAFGWSAVPDLVRRATVDLARFWWQSRTNEGDPVGMNAFGGPVYGPGLPKSVRDLARSPYARHGWTG